jgi:multiple sugar transport system permease protein
VTAPPSLTRADAARGSQNSPAAAVPFALLAIAVLNAVFLSATVATRFLEGTGAAIALAVGGAFVVAALALIVARAGTRWLPWALGSTVAILASSLAAVAFGSTWAWLPGAVVLLVLVPPLARSATLPRGALEHLTGWLFVAPAVLLLVIWHFAPAVYALALSFLKDFNFLQPASFAGLENYAVLLRDPLFWKSLLNSTWYVIGTVPVGILLATLIAILLNERVRGLAVFRTIYFLPYITALTAAAAVWKWMYNTEFGLLNATLGTRVAWLENPNGIFQLLVNPVGLELPGVLAGPSVALVSIMVMGIWHHLGYSVVILLAGLQSIPPEYYEAAQLDGATAWQRTRFITWPLLSGTTFFLAVTGLIGAFQVFTQVLVLTPGGGQLNDTLTVVKYLYDKGFRDNNYSYASAMAFALFVIVFVVTLVQNRILSRRVTYDL